MIQSLDLAVIGLGVMGANLALNFADHGFSVGVYNRSADKAEALAQSHEGLMAFETLEALVAGLALPRKILLMVPAGSPVDALLRLLEPLLAPGDVLIDGGNSFFEDTVRRQAMAAAAGIHYMGLGVSGGEEGARHGPALMPGGDKAAWLVMQPYLETIAAKSFDGLPCCRYIGEEGAGHYTKMVHNGIEYADMALIAEIYEIMRAMGHSVEDCKARFSVWNRGRLESYLIEITERVLGASDDFGPGPLINQILDTTGQKGTGRWTIESALALGVSVPTLAEAVLMRALAAQRDTRLSLAEVYADSQLGAALPLSTDELEAALYVAKICAYAQGMALLETASTRYNWQLNLADLSTIWQGGCIIRARFLEKMTQAYEASSQVTHLLAMPFAKEAVSAGEQALRKVVALAVLAKVPVPALSSAIAYLDAIRSEALHAAMLIQGQRDFFGAHTYERADRPRGHFFHHPWGRA